MRMLWPQKARFLEVTPFRCQLIQIKMGMRAAITTGARYSSCFVSRLSQPTPLSLQDFDFAKALSQRALLLLLLLVLVLCYR